MKVPNQMKRQRGSWSHRVHFAAMAELYEFDDYGQEDRPNTWYTGKDYASFERNIMHDLIVFKKNQRSRGQPNGPGDHDGTTRGLETSLSKYAHRLHVQRRRYVVKAVLETQFQLQLEGVINPAAIAFASTRCTYSSKNDARERAYEDSIDVFNMRVEDERLAKLQQDESNRGRKQTTVLVELKTQESDPFCTEDKTRRTPKSTRHLLQEDMLTRSPNYDTPVSKKSSECFNPLAGIALLLPNLIGPPLIVSSWKTSLLQDTNLTPSEIVTRA